MGPDPVVDLAIPLGQHPHLQQRMEDLPGQQLVPQLAVGALLGPLDIQLTDSWFLPIVDIEPNIPPE